MKKRFFSYYAVFTIDEDGISVRFPDLPGAFSQGDTIDDAIEHAKDCLQGFLHWLMEDGDEINQPSAPEDIEFDHAREQLCRISVDLAEMYPEEYDLEKPGRTNLPDEEPDSEMLMVRLTKAEMVSLGQFAEENGRSKSGVVRVWIQNIKH